MSERTLVEKIVPFIERFVFIKDKQIYRLLALWVIQTHLYKEFEYTGYVFVHSAEPQSGKSRLLEVLDLLVANSSGVLYNPTTAILFRLPEGTQLFDEVDAWTDGGEYLRSVLNGGFHRGSTVKRNEQDKNGKWKPVDFDAYAPRAMAGIGDGILHGTTKDRTFMIPMVRQIDGEQREKFRFRVVKPEADELKLEIHMWPQEHKLRVLNFYDDAQAHLTYLRHLRDRTQDIVEPLAAILETVHEGTKELQDRRRELLEGVNLTRKDGEDLLAALRILQELKEMARLQDPLIANASELAELCCLTPQPTEYEISEVLRRHGFQSHSVRFGDSVRKRYELSHAELADICARLMGGGKR